MPHTYAVQRNWENLQVRKYWYPDCGLHEIPKIKPCTECNVDRWTSYNYASSVPPEERKRTGIHFNMYDYQFETVWNQPVKALQMLRSFGAVTSPDFSIYNDFPDAVRIYNVYRNRWCGRFWQDNGINVVPLVNWSREDSFRFCFEGIPKHSICMISTVGDRGEEELEAWSREGWERFLETCQPTEVLIYGEPFEWQVESGVPILPVDSFTKRLHGIELKSRKGRKDQKNHIGDRNGNHFGDLTEMV